MVKSVSEFIFFIQKSSIDLIFLGWHCWRPGMTSVLLTRALLISIRAIARFEHNNFQKTSTRQKVSLKLLFVWRKFIILCLDKNLKMQFS